MSETPRGKFVWYDLMTTDKAAATEFYTSVLGWGTEQWGEATPDMPPYDMWTVDGKPMGGVMPLPEEAKSAGAPPHWIAYIAVPDCDATVAKANELGGKTLMPAMDMPEVGRFAVLSDPSGAVFAAFTPANEAPGVDGQPKVGEFSWHELLTNDYSAALEFYQELFGWEKQDAMDMGEAGIYQLFGRDSVPAGGIMNKPPEMPVGAWNYYARVDDLDAAAARVTEHGGTLMFGPMEVPGGDRVATCQDPQGAMFSLHEIAAGA